MATTIKIPAAAYSITDGDGTVLAPSTPLATITTTNDGYVEQFVTTSTSWAQVSFTGVSDPEFCVVRNIDSTDDVYVGVGAALSEVTVAQLPPGAKFETWMTSGQNIHVKSSANTPRARVFANAR